MSEKLEAIRDDACKALSNLFTEAIPDITTAIQNVVEQSQAEDTEAKFKVGFVITYNLDKNTLTHRLNYTVNHKWETEGEAPDPNQLAIPGLDGGTITIKTGGESVTVTADKFKKALKRN